jgi:CcmD family protein
MLRYSLRSLLLGACLLLAPVAALAEDGQATPSATPEDRAQTFEAVTGAVKEDVPGGPLLIAAYAVVWLAVFGYVVHLGRLHGRLSESLQRIETAVGAVGAVDKAAPKTDARG